MVAYAKPEIRCSSLDREISCPGSRTVSAKVAAESVDLGGNEGGHEVQWAGSWCHFTSAVRLRDEFGAIGQPDPLTIPVTFKPSGFDEWVSDWYVTRVLDLVPRDWALSIETALKHEFERFILTGHTDSWAISPDGEVAVINDLKRGYEIVDPAEYNWQIAGYAVLLKKRIPTLKKVLARILQPAAPDRVSEVLIEDLDALSDAVERHVNAALDNPYFFETGKACKYCPGLLICPVAHEDIINLMKKTLTKEEIDRLSGVPDIKTLGDVAAHARKMNYPCTRIVDAFKARLEQLGQAVVLSDGTQAQLVEEDGSREITDPRFVHGELSKKAGETAAWGAIKTSITAVEQVLVDMGMQKKSKKPELETAETWIRDNIGGVITRKKQKVLLFT